MTSGEPWFGVQRTQIQIRALPRAYRFASFHFLGHSEPKFPYEMFKMGIIQYMGLI